MKNKILLIIFFSVIFLTTSKSVLAVETGFVFTNHGQEFLVDKDITTSWQGNQVITTSKIQSPVPKSFRSSLLSYIGQKPEPVVATTYHNNLAKIYNYLATLKDKVEAPTIEPELVIENNIVTKFVPPQIGTKFEVYKTALETLKNLEINKVSLELFTFSQQPTKQLSETNNLGINELIASGTSTFDGSPNNRRHNIKIGVEKFVGTIIPKGSEFSFNKILGPVEAEQGFLPELVIKKTGTVPEFGGGLCQVSSTTFRAAMQAGLPITQRRNHAYAVQYYSPQGTDATIYPGVIDLKFINDTPGDILVWPYFKDKNTLVFDFYGTKDTRKVTLEKPIQYDRKTDGSMKAIWTRIVEKDGTSRTDEFKSVYQPPALYHKVEEFATATTTPSISTQ